MTIFHRLLECHQAQQAKAYLQVSDWLHPFFYPGSQCRPTDTKDTLDPTHAGTFIVCCQNLLPLFLRVPTLRFEHTAFATVLAPILLATAGIVPVFHDVLASTCSTGVDNKFCDHVPTILLITSI